MVSKLKEIQNTCGVAEQTVNILSCNETVANVGEFNILLTVHHAMILGNCPT